MDKKLDELYLPHVAPDQFMALHKLSQEVSKAAEALKASKSKEDRDKYKEVLQKYLDTRAGIIQQINNKYNIPGASKADHNLAGDPLLTPSEVVVLNASIKPVNLNGFAVKEVTRPIELARRQKATTLENLTKTLEEYSKNISMVQGAPENWTPVTPAEHLKNSALNTENIKAVATSLSRSGVSPERAQKFAEGMFLSSVLTSEPDTRLRYKDSTGQYPGTIILGFDGKGSTRRAATDDEITAIMNTAHKFGSIAFAPGSTKESAAHAMFDNGANILVTVTGQEHGIHMSQGGASHGALAYASQLTGVTVLMNKVRSSAAEFKRGDVNDPESADKNWWSIPIGPESPEHTVLMHTVSHELGHTLHQGYMDNNDPVLTAGWRKAGSNSWLPPAGLTVVSKYGMKSPYEYFAESFSKYMTTGVATPEFRKILESRGMLKSQQNNNGNA